MANSISVRITAENAQLLNAIQQTIRGFRNVDDQLDRTQRQAKETGEALEKHLGGSIQNLTTWIGTALAGLGLGVMAKEAIDLNAQWETMGIALTTVTGSAQNAEKALKWIETFTQKTPYELQQVSEAFVQLSAYGLEPQKVLQTLGDTASSLNKPLMQGVEALADAMTGEFMRLKEFGGISAKVAKDTVTFTWREAGKEVKHTVKKDTDEILGVLMDAYDRYKGGMEAQSHSFTGVLSNIMDAGKAIARQTTNKVFERLKDDLEDLLAKMQELQDDGTLDEWAKKTAKSLTDLHDAIRKFVDSGGVEFLINAGKMLMIAWGIEKIVAIGTALKTLARILKIELVGSILLTALRTGELRTAFVLLAGRFAPFLGPAGLIALLVAGFVALGASARQAQKDMSNAVITKGQLDKAGAVNSQGMKGYAKDFDKQALFDKTDTQLATMLKGYNAIISESKKKLDSDRRGGQAKNISPLANMLFSPGKRQQQDHAETIKITIGLKEQVEAEINRRGEVKAKKKWDGKTPDNTNTSPGYTEVTPGDGNADKAKREAARKAKELAQKLKAEREAYQDYLRTASENQLEETRISLEAEKDLVEEAYNHHKLSIQDYYKRKDELAKQDFEAEKANLLQQKQIEEANLKRAKTPEEERQIKTKLLQINGDLVQTEARLNNQVAKNAREKAQALEEYRRSAQALKAELEGLSPGQIGARKAQIDEKYREKLEEATSNNDQVTIDIIVRLKDVEKAKLELEDFYAKIEILKGQMENELGKVDLRTDLAPIEKEQEKLDIQKAFNDEVKKCIPDMERLMEIINDPQAVNSLNNLKLGIERVDQQAGVTKETLAGAVGRGLEDFFANGIQNCKSLGDAFRQMAYSIIQDLQRILAHQLAMKIAGSLFGIQMNADGGLIRGPGTGTSDSILSWVSNGEYIIKADSVRKFGKGFFDALNAGYTPGRLRFATGGQVGGSAGGTAGGQGINIINVQDPSLVENYITSSSGSKTLINVIESNRVAIRRLLG